MATFSRKLKLSQLAPWERAKLFQGPLSGGGKKNYPKPLHWYKPNHSRAPHGFLPRTSAGEGRRWETNADGRRKNSLNLLLDVNKKIVQVSVDGGRPGEAEKITEGPID